MGIQPELIECIAVSPTGTIMAGTFTGAFLSTDRGVTWVQKTSGLADQYLRSVTFDTDGFAYAGTANGLYRSSVATAVADDQSTSVLGNYTLYQNYSNPFNPSTTITFNLPKSCVVRLSVYDMLGREVSVLVYEKRDAGIHEVKFDGSRLASSVYLYRLTAGSFTQTRKLVLIR